MPPGPPVVDLIQKDKRLIVEGKDDARFFGAAIAAGHLAEAVQVFPIGGKDQLKINLKTLAADPGFARVSSLAVLRDADGDAAGAFDGATAALRGLGLNPPSGHAQFAAGTPMVGVFILPGGGSPGMLETLCLQSAGTGHGYNCVGSYFECLAAAGRQPPQNMDKARAHAWLAAQEKPGLRVGEAAEAGYWDFGHAAFAPLWQFLVRL